MILVTTGTNGAAFDRLLRQIEYIDSAEDVLVQHGPSQIRPSGATCVPFLSFEALVDAVRSARAVVTHGGVGSVLIAAMEGKLPFVVPRLARYGEAVDDHQLTFARRLDSEGIVTLVEDPAQLPDLLHGNVRSAQRLGQPDPRLVRELKEYFAANGATSG